MLAGADAGSLDAFSQQVPDSGAGSARGSLGDSLSLTSMDALGDAFCIAGMDEEAPLALLAIWSTPASGTPAGLFGLDQDAPVAYSQFESDNAADAVMSVRTIFEQST